MTICNLCVANCVSRIAAFPFPTGGIERYAGRYIDTLCLAIQKAHGAVGWGNRSIITTLLQRGSLFVCKRIAVVNNNAENTGRRVVDGKRNGGEKWVARTTATFPFNPRRPGFTSPRAHFTIYAHAIPSGVDNSTSQYETCINYCNTRILLQISLVVQVCSKFAGRIYRVNGTQLTITKSTNKNYIIDKTAMFPNKFHRCRVILLTFS